MIKIILSIYIFASVILLSIMFVYSYARGKSAFGRAFGLLALTADIYMLGYLLEINVESLSDRMFWNQIQYFGIPFFPVFWLLVCLLFTGRLQKAWGSITAAIFAIPVITFFLRLTNSMHGLYYSGVGLKQVGDITFVVLDKGPWYYVQMTYILVVLIMCTAFYHRKLIKSSNLEKKQFRLLFIVSLIPFISLLLIVIDPGKQGIDYTALVLPPCALLINYALSRYNFLELKLLAREKVFEESSKGLILMDKQNTIKDFNEASVRFFSWFNIKLDYKDLNTILASRKDILQSVYAKEQSIYTVKVEDENHFIAFSSKNIGKSNEIAGILLSIEDVTVRENLTMQLKQMAQTDGLTGINNRRSFVEESEKAIERAIRYDESISLLMMDIDHFKIINDTYGHTCGDSVLTAIAQLIRSTLRSTDIFGRVGGEEFAVLMINTDINEAFSKAEQLRHLVEKLKVDWSGNEINLTISIGVAGFSKHTQTLDQLVICADAAMYKAKDKGRNQTVVYGKY